MDATETASATLYDRDYWTCGEGWDDAKRTLAESYIYPEDYETDDDYEEAVERECETMDDWTAWEAVGWYLQNDLDDVICEVGWQVNDRDTVLFTGVCGLWDGPHAGGGTAESFGDALEIIAGRDCEIESVTVENGDVHVTAVHHDGSNTFTVRALTDAGWDALDDWTGDCGPLAGMDECEAHRALMGSDEWTYPIAPTWD